MLNENVSRNVLKRHRAKAALCNLFVGDSLSMPVHWFYNPGDIVRTFGRLGIDRLHAAPADHPSSIMALHSTSRGGRGKSQIENSEDIVGDVILKGRRHLWGRPNGHYHHGMQAGDNTLNAWCARELLALLTDQPEYKTSIWAQRYVDFMTADPPSHPDTYAESYHRGFFANWKAGSKLEDCGAITHDTPSMGALVTVAPLALALLSQKDLTTVSQICQEHVWLTHPDDRLMRVVEAYVHLIHGLLESDDKTCADTLFASAASVISGTRLLDLLKQTRGDAFVVGRTYSLACYITDSWPSVCYLAAKYRANSAKALLTNTNLGGENAHRGSVLGTLVGLASGGVPVDWFDQLTLNPGLDELLEHYLNKFYPV